MVWNWCWSNWKCHFLLSCHRRAHRLTIEGVSYLLGRYGCWINVFTVFFRHHACNSCSEEATRDHPREDECQPGWPSGELQVSTGGGYHCRIHQRCVRQPPHWLVFSIVPVLHSDFHIRVKKPSPKSICIRNSRTILGSFLYIQFSCTIF